MLNIENTFLNYFPEKLPNSVGIVCFHTGDWRTGKDKSCVNFVYIIKTLASLSEYVDKIFLYVCEDGMEFLCKLYEKLEVRKINPLQEYDDNKLVYPIGKYALLDKPWKGYDFVFFTESDQVIYSRGLLKFVSQLNDCQYLSPHRLERRYKHFNQNGQPIVKFDGNEYVLYNHSNTTLIPFGDFWLAIDFRSSYGAAWIAKSNLLDIVDFNQYSQKSLHTPSLVMFDTFQALKTKNVFDFFVDHLSGLDNALSQDGYSIQSFPGKW